MIPRRYTASISIKAPEYVEEVYLQKAKKKLKEMNLDIPPELVILVLKVKKLYKGSLMNIPMEDEKVLSKVAEDYGIAKGDALMLVLAHNFPEVKDFLIKLTKEENNGKETKK
jgi:hypothetical protein